MNLNDRFKKTFLYWLLEGRFFQVCSRIPFVTYERKHYGETEILEVKEGTDFLIKKLKRNKPFLAGRFGSSECNAAVQYLRKQKGLAHSYSKYQLDVMTNNAGFFPRDEKLLDKYCESVLKLYGNLDLLCIMNSVAEGYIVQEYCPNTCLTRLPVVDPIRTHWTKALESKKVLVIHPMAETITKQYLTKRKQIFPNMDILPEFDLKTVKAVQSFAGATDGRFKDWFEALDYMANQALKQDFDIALIGCGSYGLPLGALLKSEGKQAVHMGGCLQLLFGIRGARWESRPEYATLMNEAWVRPSKEEVPKSFTSVESGCYW